MKQGNLSTAERLEGGGGLTREGLEGEDVSTTEREGVSAMECPEREGVSLCHSEELGEVRGIEPPPVSAQHWMVSVVEGGLVGCHV